MTDENNPSSPSPPSSVLSRFPHPSSVPRLPPTPIYTNIHSSLPYTPTTPLPSSRFQTPMKTTKGSEQNSTIDSRFQSIPEEMNHQMNNNMSLNNVSQSLEQQPMSSEHKNNDQQQQPAQTNNQSQINSNVPFHSNEIGSDGPGPNYIPINNDDSNMYENGTNNYASNKIYSSNINVQQQQIFEQQQMMFDKHMIMMQQRIQQLESQVLFTQQESAQLKFDQSFYTQQQSWNTNNNGQQINNNISTIISKSIQKPDTFDGNAITIDAWIHSMRNYLLLAGIPIEHQVPVVTTYLKGNAQGWLVHLSPEDKSKCLTLDGFFTSLVSFFRPVNLVQATRKQLNELQQRGFDLIKFNSKFNQLVQRLPAMDKSELLDKYREKLDVKIQLTLVGKDFSELSQIQTAAIQADTALKLMKPDNNNQRFNNNYRSRVHVQQPTAVVNNMNTQQTDLDQQPGSDGDEENVVVQYAGTKKKNGKPIPKINDEIRKWCQENNACYRCRQVGHSSANCTTFPRSTNNGGTSLQPSSTPSKQHFH